jgi:hypothetical protein
LERVVRGKEIDVQHTIQGNFPGLMLLMFPKIRVSRGEKRERRRFERKEEPATKRKV